MKCQQSGKIVTTIHAPTGAVVLHTVTDDGEDIALHAAASGWLLPLIGRGWLLTFPPVVRDESRFVVIKIGV